MSPPCWTAGGYARAGVWCFLQLPSVKVHLAGWEDNREKSPQSCGKPKKISCFEHVQILCRVAQVDCWGGSRSDERQLGSHLWADGEQKLFFCYDEMVMCPGGGLILPQGKVLGLGMGFPGKSSCGPWSRGAEGAGKQMSWCSSDLLWKKINPGYI